MERLKEIPPDEWFKFKNERNPPVFTKKIMDCVCSLLRLPNDWESQKLLLSDSKYNRIAENKVGNNQPTTETTQPSPNGKTDTLKAVLENAEENEIGLEPIPEEPQEIDVDKEATNIKSATALRYTYDCKFVHLMQSYDVLNYIEDNTKAIHTATQSNRNKGSLYAVYRHKDINQILADPRFRSDSYYIENLGKVAVLLVQWVKANHAYIQTAKSFLPLLKQLEQSKYDISRLVNIHNKKKNELNIYVKNLDVYKRLKYKQSLDLSDLNEALIRASYMLKFVEDSFNYSASDVNIYQADYYKKLEYNLEVNKKDLFVIETCMESMISDVLKRDRYERKLLSNEAIANGKEYVLLDDEDIYRNYQTQIKQSDIKTWIQEEIQAQQMMLISKGYNLGYDFEECLSDEQQMTEQGQRQIMNVPVSPTKNGVKQISPRKNVLISPKSSQSASISSHGKASKNLIVQSHIGSDESMSEVLPYTPPYTPQLESFGQSNASPMSVKSSIKATEVSIPISAEIIQANICLVAEVVITRLNDIYHEVPMTTKWTLLNGKIITSRFIYILVWKYWEDAIIARRDDNAVNQWDKVFGPSIENCARIAIEAPVNQLFSATAKKQGEIWAKKHAKEIARMEIELAQLFEDNYPDQPGSMALLIYDDIYRSHDSKDLGYGGFGSTNANESGKLIIL